MDIIKNNTGQDFSPTNLGEDTNRNDLLIGPGGYKKIDWHMRLTQTGIEERR